MKNVASAFGVVPCFGAQLYRILGLSKSGVVFTYQPDEGTSNLTYC